MTASRLLSNPAVAARIARLQANIADRLGLTAEAVLRELSLLGFSNMADYIAITDAGNVRLDFSGATRDMMAAVSEIVVDEFMDGKGSDARPVRRLRFKLHDKRAALVDLGRHLNLFNGEGTTGEREFTLNVHLVGPDKGLTD